MDFKRVYTSTKTYIILLIVAIAVLLFSTSMAFKQIINTQKSANMVMHTLQVHNKLSDLTIHCSKAESEEFRKEILNQQQKDQPFEAYKTEGKNILDSLKMLIADNDIQVMRMKPLEHLMNTLYAQLENLNATNFSDTKKEFETRLNQKNDISKTLYNIRSIKNRMLTSEKKLMTKREAVYKSNKILAPAILLLLALFSLFVFVISFSRIYRNKLRFKKSEAFLKNVLGTTDNIVNYYEPIFDNKKTILDFKIIFANTCNRDYLGLEPEEIIGKTVSGVLPFLINNGELEELKRAYIEQEKVIFDRETTVGKKKMWFHTIATPLDKGVLMTARNSTAEEHAKQVEKNFKDRLEKQNLQLLDSRAFLANIFKSISHVVMHLKSIRKQGEIVDFEILFVNDKISPITGDLPEDVKNRSISEAYPNVFKKGVFGRLVDAIEKDTHQHYEVPYDQNGAVKWFQATAIKLGDGVTITSRDVTQEKEKEHHILEINETLQTQNTILNDAEKVAEIGSYTLRLDNGEATISENFYRILGYEPNSFEVTVENYKNFVHPEDFALYEQWGKDTMEIGYSNVQEYRIVTKQGHVKYLRFKSQAVEKDGHIVSLGVVQDITEKKAKDLELIRLNEDLLIQNSILTDAERMAKTGSFIWYVDKDHAEISDNFYRMLGHEPKAFISSFEKFKSFIHPDDLENYEKKGADGFKKLIPTEYMYRVVTKEGQIKHFKTNGQFVKKDGKMLMLGVVQDVTETIVAEERLLKSNLELKQSNAELESFSRVASHDLQEPLRKVQIFISRLEETEQLKLSEKGLEYFGKVTTAVKRMQSLIQNLLAYSRMDNSEKDMERLDLNHVLEKVKDDLFQSLTDTDAEVVSEQLPRIKGVAFQMEQLFTNLLSNALKYKKAEQPPKIQIQYKKVLAKEVPDHVSNGYKSYHKITFQDNGIGFKPEYNEIIFEVFQRLHQKTEYSGTGIGLAICKKIVENHKGFIFAHGNPAVGSEFVIYLPAEKN